MVEVRYSGGIELPGCGIWLDARKPKPRAFISHAHADHLGRHDWVLCSEGTAALLKPRLSGRRTIHACAFRQPLTLPHSGARVELLPAGHVLGSAQLYLESGEGTLLYTGDFKLRHGLAAEPAEIRHARTLIMETTYGLPRYAFPPADEVIDALTRSCREAIENDEVPVLLGYSLGKAQEIICALAKADIETVLHDAVHKMTDIYSSRIDGFPKFHRYDGTETSLKERALVVPPSEAKSRTVTQLPRRRTIALTGWALERSAIYRYGCDQVLPLSDHADYPDLLRMVERVQPERVFTIHGYAREFAADLRRRGIEAWALGKQEQLELIWNDDPPQPA